MQGLVAGREARGIAGEGREADMSSCAVAFAAGDLQDTVEVGVTDSGERCPRTEVLDASRWPQVFVHCAGVTGVNARLRNDAGIDRLCDGLLTGVDADPVDFHDRGEWRAAVGRSGEVAADREVEKQVKILVERCRIIRRDGVPVVLDRVEGAVEIPANLELVPL